MARRGSIGCLRRHTSLYLASVLLHAANLITKLVLTLTNRVELLADVTVGGDHLCVKCCLQLSNLPGLAQNGCEEPLESGPHRLDRDLESRKRILCRARGSGFILGARAFLLRLRHVIAGRLLGDCWPNCRRASVVARPGPRLPSHTVSSESDEGSSGTADRQTVLIGTRTHTPPGSIASRLRLCISHVITGMEKVLRLLYASPAESRRPVAPLV